MRTAERYRRRRRRLLRRVGEAETILLCGHAESPINFADNCYPFRQESSFLYYFGIDRPDLSGVIDADGDRVYGADPPARAAVWSGPQPTVAACAEAVGARRGGTPEDLRARLVRAGAGGGRLHYLPPTRTETLLALARFTGRDPQRVGEGVSEALMAAVIRQRSRKSALEVAEIEAALEVSARWYAWLMAHTRPGASERRLAAGLHRILVSAGSRPSFAPIVTVRGERLHNPRHENLLAEGDLLLADTGAESRAGYASDITRTLPVSGRFTGRRRAVYEIVLAAQRAGIRRVRPGTAFADVHRAAARRIAAGLADLGLMRGDPDEAEAAGAHALFFPHGFGHMLGLDVHDMESLGEDRVGYGPGQARSRQFGRASLRLARPLEAGFTVTAEPGIYFIPELVAAWRREGRHRAFIDYGRVEAFMGLGGVRIEDDLLVTDGGCRVLSAAIPKRPAEIEAAMGGG